MLFRSGRKIYDAVDIFQAKIVSQYIKDGLMPMSLVAKRFGNDGGVLSQDEIAHIDNLDKRYLELQKQISEITADKAKNLSPEKSKEEIEKQNALLIEMVELQTEIEQIKNSFATFYENTAEMKSRKKTIEWWILNLSLKKNDKDEYVLYFPQASFDEKYQEYINVLDGDNIFEKDVVNKFSYLISSWLNSGFILTSEQFKNLDENFEKNVKENVR